jgi:sugar-specific transcriptional regulator TrmB
LSKSVNFVGDSFTPVAGLAEAANIPLGSLHSILQSLEKKGLIKNTRSGSARAPAAYQVL